MGLYRTLKDLVSRRNFFVFPVKNHSVFSSIKLYVRFIKEFKRFNQKSTISTPLNRAFPILNENTPKQGSKPGHYFYQPLWLLNKLKESDSSDHVDVGSQIDMLGFVALEKSLTYVDIRDPQIELPKFEYIQASVTKLPFKSGSIQSLSSLHVIEHIGLGRYGDPIDPAGHVKALEEISRVMAPGGHFYLSIPCGKERVEFNAHRVFHPKTIINLLPRFELLSLGGMIEANRYYKELSVARLAECSFGCGFFHFKKKR